ncbi:MAG: paraquat-inducible protein A [Proteobacteria bacterium]|nr:paraquat-inducible protein A [Pseudomonadota bacterium]
MSASLAVARTVDAETSPRLHECRDCGQMQVVPPMPPATRAMCLRCDAVLRHTRHDPLRLPLALNVAALVLIILGATLTVIDVSSAGQGRAAALLSGAVALDQFGLWELSVVLLITTLAAPLARVLSMLTVLGGLYLPRPPAELRAIYAWIEHIRPWSMVEIYLLALFVAYVRLSDMAQVEIGPATYALGALMVVMVLADYTLDRHAVWEAMEPPNRARVWRDRRAAVPPLPDTARRWRIGCDTCELVSRSAPGQRCPRCGFRLHDRKPWVAQRTWALIGAAAVLYVPANVYPVLTVVRLGSGAPSTIMGGVRELIDAGMWPLAALVFFASVVVPVLKLAGLALLLVMTQRGSIVLLRDRTVLYRVIEAIGRWSMIDIFMGSILVALVQFGALASIYPGPGALAFAAVVVLTMLASRSFDPRLMWDRLRPEAA